MRATQHAGLRTVDTRTDLSPPAPADGARLSETADRNEPEEPAAPQDGRVVA